MLTLDSSHILNTGRRGLVGLLDLILPPRCLSCREIVPEQGKICAPCWNQVPFMAGPRCRACAVPLDASATGEPMCERCAFEPPPWEQAAVALRYEAMARRLILNYKHGDRSEGAEVFADWLAMVVRPLANRESLILPVPLHRWRLLARGYNQSALLARPLARLIGCDVDMRQLWRPKPSRSQQGLSAKERQENVAAEQFALHDPFAVSGRHVILVDDVLTTGSTFAACTTVLLRAGAARVDVAALARVVRPETGPI